MNCLGIESTAHTFGVGIVTDKGKILANIKEIFTTESGGMIPNKVAEHHRKIADTVIEEALGKANLKLEDINLISFSKGPGLAPSLVAGMEKAKQLAEKLNIPLVGVNHCIAHLEIGNLLTGAKDPVLLYASGVNTQIIAFEGGKYRIFGETLDIGIGNFLDSFARELGIGFPGGPKIEQLAKQGKDYIEIPYVVKGMDVSFGGMLTNLKQKILKKYKKEDLAFSAQETSFAMLIEVAERAMAHCGKKELLLGGGVCCNKRLQEMAKIMCKERNAECFVPENEFLVDNAAMIAWQGILEHKAGRKEDLKKVDIMPHWRTDQVDVVWRE
ncbi:bifunctional N(6)-L-threonylcarbamoyladenine synthase/serine/threonine protein kinase [Candidatus Woesearchaeota archaeon]|nr:bifunctional N(6)-L-threonylcarbamoyladenine synthase/serine/threonine protein kinase [Candidatus Woesearchaeota archaeon]